MSPAKLGFGFWALTAFLLALLAFAGWGLSVAWRMSGNVGMSVHGYVALGLGVGFSLLIGGGLMALAFYSSRRGFDDDQGR
jgi:hypothetical protein